MEERQGTNRRPLFHSYVMNFVDCSEKVWQVAYFVPILEEWLSAMFHGEKSRTWSENHGAGLARVHALGVFRSVLFSRRHLETLEEPGR